jgi:uncharacterized membrane protein
MSAASEVQTESGRAFPMAAQSGSRYVPLPDKTDDGRVTAHAVQTILVEAQALYKLWSDVTSIPLWQEQVVSVTSTGAKTSHWVMGNPEDKDGKRIEFDSELTEDVPGQKIAWRSVTEGVEQSGEVTFVKSPVGRGTIVTLIQTARVPGGVVGEAAASLAKRGPKQIVIEDLRHFKALAESGEIPTVEGQPHGPRGISGGLKEWMYGENNPTPPGTSEEA